jgi:uncharacterized membrane protein
MHAEFVALRFIHVLSGITWVGAGIFSAFFLIPAISGSPETTMQVLSGLRRRGFFIFLPVVAALTVLSGLRMLWIDSAGFAGSYFDSATGKAFGWGGLSAIIAFIIAYGVALPLNIRTGKFAARLKDATPGDRDRLSAALNRTRQLAARTTMAAVLFGILAASAMAVARYL